MSPRTSVRGGFLCHPICIEQAADPAALYKYKPRTVWCGAFTLDIFLRFAIIKNLEIIGEAAYLLTNEFKEKHPEIEWKIIIGMRHVLVHGYYQISDEMVWATIQTELQPLKEKIEQYNRELE